MLTIEWFKINEITFKCHSRSQLVALSSSHIPFILVVHYDYIAISYRLVDISTCIRTHFEYNESLYTEYDGHHCPIVL